MGGAIANPVRDAVSNALGVDPKLLDEAAVSVEARDISPGDVLISRGDVVDDVFVVLKGSVEVVGFDEQRLAVLGPESVVGEVAVLAGGARTATVRPLEVCEVASIDRESFERLVAAAPDLHERISTEAIRRLDHRWLVEFVHWLLGSVDPTLGDAIAQVVTWRRVKAGEYVYREGDVARGGFTVIRGRIRVNRGDRDAYGSTSYEVGKGSLIGEEGLVEEIERPDSAVALRDSVVVAVPRMAFLALLETYPKVVASVLANLMRQRAENREIASASSFTLVSTDHLLKATVRTDLLSSLSRFGRTAWISSEKADQLLDKPGAAQSLEGTPGDVRLSQLLYEVEQESVYMLFDADIDLSPWSQRVLRQADTVVIAVHADVTNSSLELLDRQLAEHPTGRRVLAVFHSPSTDRPAGTGPLVERWEPDLVVHIGGKGGEDIAGLARVIAERATGLVLGGGGARGFAHLGVWRALAELGVDVDYIGGASMGAAMGALLARGGDIDLLEAEVQAAFTGLLDYTLPMVSLVKGKRASRLLERALGEWKIEDLWTPFFCTSTNLTHSRLVVHDRGDLARAVRASTSIPGVFPPVAWETDLLVDSGVLNNLPADVMRRRMPNGRIIAVDVAPPVGPRSHGQSGLSVSATEVIRSRFARDDTRYPRLIPVLLRSMITASMRERDRTVQRGDIDLYLDLDMRGISLLDFDWAMAVAKAGYEAAAPRIEAWLEQDPK